MIKHISYTVGFWIAMNLDKWNKLPKDIKDVFESIREDSILKRAAVWDGMDKESMDASKAKGHTFNQLSEKEKVKWKKAVQPLKEAYINKVESKGKMFICKSIR